MGVSIERQLAAVATKSSSELKMSNLRLLASATGTIAFFCLVTISEGQTLECGQDRLGVARQAGDTWSPDGCNSCRCLSGGRAGCTRRLCQTQAGVEGSSCQEGAQWQEKTGGQEAECRCSGGSPQCSASLAGSNAGQVRGEPVLVCGVDGSTGRVRQVGDEWTEECNSCRCLTNGLPACTRRVCSVADNLNLNLNPKSTGTGSVN